MAPEEPKRRSYDRRTFIKTSAGAAVAATPAAIALSQVHGASAAGQPGSTPARKPIAAPETTAPQEPVMAYVHDAQRGEVTVMSGTQQTTYRDPALAKQLIDAAPTTPTAIGDGTNVIAP